MCIRDSLGYMVPGHMVLGYMVLGYRVFRYMVLGYKVFGYMVLGSWSFQRTEMKGGLR